MICRNEVEILEADFASRKPSKLSVLKKLEATMGFEPMIRVLQTLALASWPRRLAE